MSAAYIRNRCYSRITKTPFEAFTGIKPNVSNICIPLELNVLHIKVDEKKKLDTPSEGGMFVGYDSGSPAFLVYVPLENKIERVRCVRFTEKNLVSEQNDESVPTRYNDVCVDPVIENRERDNAIVEGDRNDEESNQLYPSRDRSVPKKLDDYVVYSVDSQASVCVD